jgi:hypothetical protein
MTNASRHGTHVIPRADCVLFGAFERHNFGDLLMGYLFEVLLGRHGINVIYASILENDLRSRSGNKIYSIFDLVASGLDTNTPLLHVGGEIIPCSFIDALLADSPGSLPDRQRRTAAQKLRELLSTSRLYPYITPHVEVIGNRQVHWPNRFFYGTGYTKQLSDVAEKALLQKALAGLRFAGFRDRQSLENALDLGIANAQFTPDVVLAISTLLPPEDRADPNYVLFHFNRNYLCQHGGVLLDQLQRLAAGFEGDLKIAIAGTVYGADSPDEIQRFQAAARERRIEIDFLPSEDIFDICRQIASASIVVSTSLHYRIVARSYGIPRLTMDVPKVNHWARSNDDAYPLAVAPESLASEVLSLAGDGAPVLISSEQDALAIDAHVAELAGLIHAVKPSLNRRPLVVKTSPPQAPALNLWQSSMSQCLDEKDAIIERQTTLLASKSFLLRKLLSLSLGFRGNGGRLSLTKR